MRTPTRGSLTAAYGHVEHQKGGLRRVSGKCSGQGHRRPECEPAKRHDSANGSSAAHLSWPEPDAPPLTTEEFVASELARIGFEVTLSRPALFGRVR